MFGPRTVTLEDVLHNEGAASVMIHFLELKAKRNLRLVCHAGKDAVDRTVTFLCVPAEVSQAFSTIYPGESGIDYACILSNSNWKDIKKLIYNSRQIRSSGNDYYEPQGLTKIAEGGLSKLESLTLDSFDIYRKDREGADKLLKAGWKLKELRIFGWPGCEIPLEWFAALVRDTNWPLEELTIELCTQSIASLIPASEWKLKNLSLYIVTPSSEGVETLMQGSWVSTVEKLSLSFDGDFGVKGIRAISQASHRAVNLSHLTLVSSRFGNEHALILGEGSYPNLKIFKMHCFIKVSGLAAVLRKCPKLELFEFKFHFTLAAVDDPEDAKLVAQYYKNGILKISGDMGVNEEQILDAFEAQLADYL